MNQRFPSYLLWALSGIILIGVIVWTLRPPSVDSSPKALSTTSPQERAIPSSGTHITEIEKALSVLLTAPAGQITGHEVIQLKDILVNKDPATQKGLRLMSSSADGFARLLAFRLLLDSQGWSAEARKIALSDPLVLMRSEAADWLYLNKDFAEWESFVAAAAADHHADYESIKSVLDHNLLWGGFPAGLTMLDIGRGLDRYFQQLLRRNDAVASIAREDLLSGLQTPNAQQELLSAFHVANRPDYRELLLALLALGGRDTPARYQGIWRLGQDFPSPETLAVLERHISEYPSDPLRPRIYETLESIRLQLGGEGLRLQVLEARLTIALQEGNEAKVLNLLEAVTEEGLRHPSALDKDLFIRAADSINLPEGGYATRRWTADLMYVRGRK